MPLLELFLQALLSKSKFTEIFSRRTVPHKITGSWKSSWGPLPKGPIEEEETLVITKQIGETVKGYVTKGDEPSKKWIIEGRYNGSFLMLIYYPDMDCQNPDFLDYGCYFFKRKADGSFEGYSTGYGILKEGDTTTEGTYTDYHTLEKV